MSNAFLLIPILLPMLLGGLFALLPFHREKAKKLYLIASTLATSAIMIFLILRTNNELFALFTFSGDLDIALNLDGLGKIFAFLVCVLWPLTTIYALEYMKHESRQKMFYTFFLLSYGVTLGIAASGNLLTLYFFYELLTLCTLPLVLQPMNRASRRAGRSYLLYSIGGAAFAFIGMVFVFTYAGGAPFTMGGILSDAAWNKRDMLLVVYVAAFLGFGVKTAVFPLHAWLPKASVAPTPVTALLHAVAVVKAGAFAVIRLTYYCFGTEFLFGTWAQNVV
ncbi:MAG: proton-conducting membrane transporter, partial [Clostridia bacterium]|nr:proton-conducting membrane transporter [Clostridia bacterium]